MDKWNTMGTFTFVEGRLGIMPYHFIWKLYTAVHDDPTRLDRPIRLSHGSDEANPGFLLTVREVLEGHKTGCLAKKDVVLVEVPKRIPERKSIVKFFARRRQLDFNQTNLEVVLANVSAHKGFYFGQGKRFPDTIGIDAKHIGVAYTIDESFVYDIPT
jgi:hypothetical protein